MVQPITPFQVRVIKPSVPPENGGLQLGQVLTVRAIHTDSTLQGTYIYFMVWNEKHNRFMLEAASQFEPVEK